jgi:DNA-binding NarL/FixJ family response regulator
MTDASPRAPIRVMIVDDHPVVRNGLIGMFEGEAGFEVVGDVGDGAEAVRRAEALAPDVILMDLRMPEMDGVTEAFDRGLLIPRHLSA